MDGWLAGWFKHTFISIFLPGDSKQLWSSYIALGLWSTICVLLSQTRLFSHTCCVQLLWQTGRLCPKLWNAWTLNALELPWPWINCLAYCWMSLTSVELQAILYWAPCPQTQQDFMAIRDCIVIAAAKAIILTCSWLTWRNFRCISWN